MESLENNRNFPKSVVLLPFFFNSNLWITFPWWILGINQKRKKKSNATSIYLLCEILNACRSTFLD